MANFTGNTRIQEEKRIMGRWDWLTGSIDEHESRLNTAMVLENSYQYMVNKDQIQEGWLESVLNEDSLNEAPTVSGAVGQNLIPKVLFPMIRRVFPKLISNDLVSVQPITGPQGVIYYIIYNYSDTKGKISAGDEYSALPQQQLPGYATFYSSEKIGPFSATIAANGGDTTIDVSSEVANFLGTDVGEFSIKRVEVYNATTPNMSAYGAVHSAGNGGPAWDAQNVHYQAAPGTIHLRDAAAAPWTAGDEVLVYLVYDQEASSKIPEMEFSIG